HGHEVAEPHVGQLVGDDVDDRLQLGLGGRGRVDEQEALAEGDAAQVLHRPEGEVGDGDEVELVARVGQVEPVGEVPQGELADLKGEAGQVLLAGRADHPQGHAVDVDRVGGHQRADHEGHQVG